MPFQCPQCQREYSDIVIVIACLWRHQNYVITLAPFELCQPWLEMLIRTDTAHPWWDHINNPGEIQYVTVEEFSPSDPWLERITRTDTASPWWEVESEDLEERTEE